MTRPLWSIRMRASAGERHISGAEGLHDEDDIPMAVRNLVSRALGHERGTPDRVIVTVERLIEPPLSIRALPVYTIDIRDKKEAEQLILEVLQLKGIPGKAVDGALSVLRSDRVMRGATLIGSSDGMRLEPDRIRGTRVSRIGISPGAKREMEKQLKENNMNTSIVTEAIVLASKVAYCPDVIAELCISDDPSYTTGYIAIKPEGYIRIPNIKSRGCPSGGRAYFLKSRCNVSGVIDYLEKRPVMVTEPSRLNGIIEAYEFIRSINH
ncbi:MAG TPA: 6-carboxyhexanoate--CoA ligase [Nitrospirae bacterium]|nr:6-carboxyhexanoate--CoA ligase [Nitrospirota bacterium]HDY71657.1 6-carboxyhexanoate--CoA ligase [Nitrospirota bacterium]